MTLTAGINLAYLMAAVLFIVGLSRLSSPATARSGNLVASVGMLIAVVATLLDRQIVTFWTIALGVLVGTVIGAVSARMVKMTAMPQMVALFNGVGGGAAALVAAAEFRRLGLLGPLPTDTALSILLSTVIGSISFAGSLVAFAKLQDLMTGRPITYPLQQVVNGLVAAAILLLMGYLLLVAASGPAYVALLVLALVLGVAFVLPIGGADMPVVISLLNSFTGVAAAATGFVLGNNVLIIAGALVGASGTILTRLMSKAMGRSLGNVLFGAFGSVATGGPLSGPAGPETRPVRSASAEDVAALLAYARSVIIVPGYGLAVAQAQHAVRELADLLEKRGVDVKYAIHPVAGRMPGHMNVLLAEANVPYTQLYEMDAINSQFAQTDVALVIGANDVTNPAARTSPGSPIYGMPILDVDGAANVVVLKRSMKPGFAGIDNELYYNPKTTMLFDDAKESITKLVNAVKAL
jgi:NAD(P) transhydrogenase subunit beta